MTDKMNKNSSHPGFEKPGIPAFISKKDSR
jgi:hypothetical protein